MTNKRLCRVLRADCDQQPQHGEAVDAASTVVGEGSHRTLAGILLNRSVADYSDNDSRIDLIPGGRSAAHDRKRLSRGENPAPTTLSGIPVVECPRGVRYTNEEATPLPHWMRATRPSRAGMFIPGLLTALAVLAAISGILSTILELAWL
jgi:hypothetical protein